MAANYSNNAVNLKGTVNNLGAVTAGATTQTVALTIGYDPASGTYRLTRPDGGRSFGPNDLSGVDATTKIPRAEYVKTIGDGYENLIISTMPGTSTGRLNWVGQGQFVRRVANGSDYSFDTDAFYFGIPTAAGQVPTTGSATYSVYMLGGLTKVDASPYLLQSGTTDLVANFDTGAVSITGDVQSYNILTHDISSLFNFSGSATISANGFSGTFMLDSASGTWNGDFFGPNGQEVGSVFRSDDGDVDYAGTLVGSSELEFRGIETDFLDMDNFTSFSGIGLESYQYVDASTGATTYEGGITGGADVHFDPYQGTWTLNNTFRHNDIDYSASQSDSSFDVYGDVTVDTDTGTNGLRLLKSGPGNPTIELTYTKLGIWEVGNPTPPYDFSIQRRYAVFGFKTAPDDMPVTGSASYSGLVFGVGNSEGGASNAYYGLGGTVALTADFAAGAWSGTLNPIGTDRNGGAVRDFGTLDFTNGVISGNELQTTDLTFGSSGDIGDIYGLFFGTKAAEFGGGFDASMSDPDRPGYTLNLDAVFLGKKD